MQRNDIYESVLQARGFVVGENLLNTKSKDDATRLFLLGRLDLLIASDFTVKSLIEKQGASLDELEAIAYLDTPEIKGNYLAMNPQAVSYTPLTLPTSDPVSISVIDSALKHQQTTDHVNA